MRMRKKQFRIGHLAQALGVDDFVIRFWEKEFRLSPHRSQGGQRFYTDEDLEQFKNIQDLLHNKGFTIAGAKRLLNQHGQKNNAPIHAQKQPLEPADSLVQKCILLKAKLTHLKSVLQ